MKQIIHPKQDTREKVNIVGPKDLKVSYFCGSGAGGQARNKVHSGCQIVHIESGASGRASDSRSLDENKQSAFKRLLADPKMRFFIARRVHEVQSGETLEAEIERETQDKNLKYEVKNATGQWEQVEPVYFESETAKEQSNP